MDISIRHIGGSGITPASSIELTVSSEYSEFTTDVTDLRKEVDVYFIAKLRQIADELEEQNRLVEEQRKFNNL